MDIESDFEFIQTFSANESFLNGTNSSIDCSFNSTNGTFNPLCFYDYDSIGLPLEEVIPVSLVYGLTLFLGLIGNSLVIWSISRFRRMRSITNVFLLSLASADLLLVLICVPIKCAAFFSFSWTFGWFLCKFVNYMQNVSMICSVMTLTAMSVERLIAIKLPLRSKSICTMRHAQVTIIFIWSGSFLLATPILIGQKHIEVGELRKAYWCIKEWDEPSWGLAYEVYMLVLMFIIPVGVMVISYTAVILEVWKVINQRSSMRYGNGVMDNRKIHSVEASCTNDSGDKLVPSATKTKKVRRTCVDDDNTRKQVVIMLITIVVVFAVCWGPILINNLLVALRVLPQLHLGHIKHVRQALFLLSYCNSCVNPVVYGFMSKHFRASFKSAICSLLRGTSHLVGRHRTTLSTWRSTHATFASRTDITADRDTTVCYTFDSKLEPEVASSEPAVVPNGMAMVNIAFSRSDNQGFKT